MHQNTKTPKQHAIYYEMANRGPASRQEGYTSTVTRTTLVLYNMLGLGVLSLRYAARSLATSRALRYQQCQPTHRRDALRTFSTTPRRLASEVPDDFVDAIRHTELFKKLADKPKALKALSDLYELAKEMGAVFPLPFRSLFLAPRTCVNLHLSVEGIDINSMTPPSEIRMFQLVTNIRLMRVVKRVIDEFKAAGFKMNSDVRF
jgi:hypothetical protein